MTRRITVRGIIVYRGKLLCCRLTDYRNGVTPDYWCVPGGGLEENEPILLGLDRELNEELGVRPKIGSLLYIQQYGDGEYEQLELLFNIENPEDYLNIDLSKTTHGLEEIKEIDFIDPKINKVLPEFLSNQPIKIGQSVKLYSYL